MKSAKDDPKVSDVYQTNQFNISNSINFQTIKNESMNVYEKQRNSMYQKNDLQNKDILTIYSFRLLLWIMNFVGHFLFIDPLI